MDGKTISVANHSCSSTYPSVYLVYIDISATGGCGVVGSTYTRLTQAYATGDLRTQLAQERAGDNPTLNLSDLFDNCTARGPTESYPRPVCVTQVGERLTSCLAQAESVNSKALFEQLHCYPSLYYPTTKLLEADPAWTTCIPPRLQPMFDPPRTLVPAAAMAPIPTSASHQPVAAVPASIVDPPRASKTPPPSKPESVPGSGNDPSGKDPPSQDPPKNGLHSGDPPLLSASASNHPVDDPPASDPPANKPLESGPSTRDPAASNPSANNPPIGKPPANVPMRNDPANGPSGNGSPIQDPQNSVKPAQNPSKDRSQYPSPSFAIPIPEGPTLPGIVINPSSVVVAGSTIRSGASAVQSKDHQVSLDPGAPNVIVDGQAHASSTTSPLPVAWGNSVPALTDLFTTPYGHNIQAAPNPGVISVDGQSITGGANSVTIASIPSAPHSNEDLALGISTIRGSLPPSTTSPQVFTAAGQAATVLPNGVAVAGTTIIPNAPAVVVAGTSYSLGTNGLIVGTSTMTYPTPAPSAIIIATGKATTPLANDHVIMSGSSSYAPGMTIGETPVSLGTNSLAVGTSTLALPSSPLTSSVVIVGEMLPSSLGTNVVAICSTTLQSIQTAITIPGTPVSLGTSGPATGSSTGLLSSTVSTDGVGGYVFSGFNGGMGSPSATSSVVILGSGARLKVRWSACTIIIVIVISFT